MQKDGGHKAATPERYAGEHFTYRSRPASGERRALLVASSSLKMNETARRTICVWNEASRLLSPGSSGESGTE